MIQPITDMVKISLIFMFCFPMILFAQDNWENEREGELEDSQVIIEKNRTIELPKANRDFLKVPKIERTIQEIPVEFSTREFIPILGSIQPRIRVLTVKDETLDKLYANQIKIGVGNYGASFLEGNFASKRSKNKSYGLYLFHHSFANGVIDGRNSGSGYQEIKPYASLIFGKATLEADIYYQRFNNHLYGYDTAAISEVDRDSIQRTFHLIGTNLIFLDRNKNSKYHYQLGLNAYQLFTNYQTGEYSIDFKLNNNYDLNENIQIALNANGFFSQVNFNNQTNTRNRNLFRIQPGLNYQKGKLQLKAGLNFVYENDTLINMNQLHVYPDLRIGYHVFDKIQTYAGIKGDVRTVKYKDLLLENPYLTDSIAINHTLMPFQFYGGVKGAISNIFAFETGFSIASVQHNYAYVGDFSAEQNETRYQPLYFSENNTEANVFLALSGNVNQFRFNMRGDYFYYNIDTTFNMPYRPNYQLHYDMEYLFAAKLLVGLNGHLQGKMNSVLTQSSETLNIQVQRREIPAIYDLGIKFTYLLTERAQVFLQANNLLANKYEYYLAYPNRGFQLLGGFTYSF